MRSLPRSLMGPVWGCPSAAPSLNRIAAACGLPTTLRTAQVFTSFYPPKSRHMNDARGSDPRVYVSPLPLDQLRQFFLQRHLRRTRTCEAASNILANSFAIPVFMPPEY